MGIQYKDRVHQVQMDVQKKQMTVQTGGYTEINTGIQTLYKVGVQTYSWINKVHICVEI